MLGTIFLLAGLLLLSQKQIKISSTRTIEGKATQRMALLFILPALLAFYTTIAPKNSLTVSLAYVALAGYALAILVTIYLVAFYKPGKHYTTSEAQIEKTHNHPAVKSVEEPQVQKSSHAVSTNGKTLHYLNSKAWYRLTKVFYVIGFLLVAMVTVIGVYEESKPIKELDNINSVVRCDDGRTIGLDENNIHLTSEYIYTSDDKIFRKICAYDPNNPININPDNPAELARLNPSYKNYVLIPAYETKGDNLTAILYCFLSLAGVVLVFEIVRRVFYYVMLGKFIPNRH